MSLEANPGTLSLAYLRDLRSLGFNRISLGVQSAQAAELRQLERSHNFFEVIEAVKWTRQAGFDNLNLDLIYGLPEQTLERWQSTLRQTAALQPEHLSLYALTIEHGTPFGLWAARGLMASPDPDLSAEMYEWASDFLEAEGYVQYEISNWALDDGRLTTDHCPSSIVHGLSSPSYACKHNLQYWRNLPYLGFGAGAHGWAAGYRYSNVLRIKTYIERMAEGERRMADGGLRIADGRWQMADGGWRVADGKFPLSLAVVSHQRATVKTEMQETMLTGLRLTREGVSATGFRERFGRELTDIFGREIDELVGLGLLEWVKQTSEVSATSDVLRLTKRGRLLGNQVFIRFVD